jgi:hypothetical protein
MIPIEPSYDPVGTWFETREDALLTMRGLRPHPEEHRESDAVSKDESLN